MDRIVYNIFVLYILYVYYNMRTPTSFVFITKLTVFNQWRGCYRLSDAQIAHACMYDYMTLHVQ